MRGLRVESNKETLRRVRSTVKTIPGRASEIVNGRELEVADQRRPLVECLVADRAANHPEEELLSIPKFALDILVCPLCKTRVELLADESGLKCVSCRRVYPIRDDIPVMLPEEATVVEESRNK
jgi:uncharacterized protein YbaR (Trm112 family)